MKKFLDYVWRVLVSYLVTVTLIASSGALGYTSYLIFATLVPEATGWMALVDFFAGILALALTLILIAGIGFNNFILRKMVTKDGTYDIFSAENSVDKSTKAK